jgi:hypothetical protein
MSAVSEMKNVTVNGVTYEWRHSVDDKLIKTVDESVWRVTNRLIDVDHNTALYTLEDTETGFNDTETLTVERVEELFTTPE